ncbi:peptidylprolyl isomerase [Xanthobacter tagetidis]|uniref:Peptidylprolyl isomerase n=1 Tax=Xanthobacter tagetidis TaxID=60216 RepID=A0A3L7AQI3_9HYPH|nr:peptidylprolyl isomerase [Xanthobacter tagetidis]MBB6308308.1 peptidyl-prolyl cis-trans isomerase SurA [Xanthobacter tagetidis]RLP81911.1 peptidylprolyl isomerase [Xanthobacter tagetidis]
MPFLIRVFIAAVLATFAMALPAAAQKVVVVVNGDPITSYDVSQRQRLHQMIERKSISPKEALDELIDDRIKFQQARRLQTTVDQADIDRMYAGVAERSGRTAAELTASFAQGGLDARIFKDKLAADYVWSQYVRGRAGTTMIRDSDVVAALQMRGTTQLVATEYTLYPIVFVVPRNGGNHSARLQEANGLRQRFTNCEAGLAMAKGLKEVVVRQPILRLSSDMPTSLRQLLDKTEVGRLTPPEVSQFGVETFAICNKTEVRGESSQKREIKDQLSTAQFTAESKKMIAELRKTSLIEYR